MTRCGIPFAARVLIAVLLAGMASASARAQAPAPFASRLAAAEALFQKGDTAHATAAFRQLAAEFPAKPEPWWYLGLAAFQQGKAAEASAAFEQLTAKQPDGGAGWVMLGLSEFRASRYDDALVHIEQGRFLGGIANPQIEQLAKSTQAMLCTRIGRFDVALAVLSELAVANVKTPTVVATFGLAALNRAQLLDQVPATDQRLVLEAGQAAWLIGAKRTEDSIREAEALLERHPGVGGLHAILATALIRHDWPRAEKEFRAELSANGDHYFANLTLASELLERARNAEALPFAETAARLRPDNLIAQALYGRALVSNGKAEQAIAPLEKAVELDPVNPNVRYSLAVAYARAGRKDDAAAQREIFAKLQAEAAKP